MGFRFRKSISLGSGVRINISKHGLSSVSIGRRGATLNIGSRGFRETIGLPGTGLSYTTGAVSAAVALVGIAVGALFGLTSSLVSWLRKL